MNKAQGPQAITSRKFLVDNKESRTCLNSLIDEEHLYNLILVCYMPNAIAYLLVVLATAIYVLNDARVSDQMERML